MMAIFARLALGALNWVSLGGMGVYPPPSAIHTCIEPRPRLAQR